MKLWMACFLLASIGIAHAQIPDYLQKAADQGEAKAELQVGIEYQIGFEKGQLSTLDTAMGADEA